MERMTNNNDDGARSGTSSTASGAAASAAAEPINEEATLPVSKTDDKSRVLGRDAISLAKVCLIFIIVVAGVGLAGYLLKFIWVGLLPVILAILVCTVLFPVTNWLRAGEFVRAGLHHHAAGLFGHHRRRLRGDGPGRLLSGRVLGQSG